MDVLMILSIIQHIKLFVNVKQAKKLKQKI